MLVDLITRSLRELDERTNNAIAGVNARERIDYYDIIVIRLSVNGNRLILAREDSGISA